MGSAKIHSRPQRNTYVEWQIIKDNAKQQANKKGLTTTETIIICKIYALRQLSPS